jgi:hypothetical protein
MPGSLADAIEQELDRLAQLEQFPDFVSKLQATITPYFKVAKSAAHWSRLTAENVVDDWLADRYVLRKRNREIVIARRPNVSTTDALKKLTKCADWEQAWFGLPKDARYALAVAAAETKQKMKRQYYHLEFQAWSPSRESVIPLIDPAIALTPVFNTNSKFERDALLGFMLRMWRCRNLDDRNRWTGPPRHDEAWRFIERIETCYRPFFAKHDPAAAAPREGFDIPLRKATREEIHKRFVLGQHQEATADIEKSVKKALSPWTSH